MSTINLSPIYIPLVPHTSQMSSVLEDVQKEDNKMELVAESSASDKTQRRQKSTAQQNQARRNLIECQKEIEKFFSLLEMEVALSETAADELLKRRRKIAEDARDNKASVATLRKEIKLATLDDNAENQARFLSKMNNLENTPDEKLSSLTSSTLGSLSVSLKDLTSSTELAVFNAEMFPDADISQSDMDIAEKIIALLASLQSAFLDPFMDATEKMNMWYEALSQLREVVATSIKPGKDADKVVANGYAIVSALEDLLNSFGNAPLFPSDGSGVSKAEAEDWLNKLGAGTLKQLPDGSWRVEVDTSALVSFKNMAKLVLGFTTSNEISITEYNNFMSALDTFLQKEQGKLTKVVNNLDYFNKLLANVREVISDFVNQCLNCALSAVRNF